MEIRFSPSLMDLSHVDALDVRTEPPRLTLSLPTDLDLDSNRLLSLY